MAPATRRTVVEGLCHLLDFFVRKAGIAQQARAQDSGYGEVPAIDRQQQFRTVAGDVFLIARCQIHLAFGGTARALGADAHIVLKGYAIIGVLQNGSEGFQKPAWAILYEKIFDVITNRQALLSNYLGLFGGTESFASFFQTQRLHGSSDVMRQRAWSAVR